MANPKINVVWKWRGLWSCEVLGARAWGFSKETATRRVFAKLQKRRFNGPRAYFPGLAPIDEHRVVGEIADEIQKRTRKAFGPLEDAAHETRGGKVVKGTENRRLFGLGGPR